MAWSDRRIHQREVLNASGITWDEKSRKQFDEAYQAHLEGQQADLSGLHVWEYEDSLLVAGCEPHSPAEAAGLQPYMEIQTVNDRPTTDLDLRDVKAILASGEGVQVVVGGERDGDNFEATMVLAKRPWADADGRE